MARKHSGIKYNMIQKHIKTRAKLVRLCRKLNIPEAGKRKILIDKILELPVSTIREAVDAYGLEKLNKKQRHLYGIIRRPKSKK